ncbi:MAG: YjgN family protein [Thiogranum sp.]
MEITMNPSSQTLPFKFHGKSGEYFRIWIVNVVLSILTLGIYSAWAKVRNKRYFYSNTELDGSTFEYLANPVAILKGRLLALGVFAVYSVTVWFIPLSEPVFVLAFIAALPWLIVRAMTFNARNSAFRNIRFDFNSNYLEAAKVFIGIPLLVMLTLGLAYPYFAYRYRDFLINNSGFGTTGFDFDGQAKQFYLIYLKAFGALLLLGLLVAVALPALIPDVQSAGQLPNQELQVQGPQLFLMMLPFLVIFPVYMLIGTYIHTATLNTAFNHAYTTGQRFSCKLKVGRMFWIYLSNFVGVLLSLGLLIPWAKIRIARYRLENLALQTEDDLDGIIAGEQQRVKATGEELAEVLDIDLGF